MQNHYITLQTDPLDDPLTTRPIVMCWEMSIEQYPNQQFGFIEDLDRRYGDRSVPTLTRTQSGGPAPLLTLPGGHHTISAPIGWVPLQVIGVDRWTHQVGLFQSWSWVSSIWISKDCRFKYKVSWNLIANASYDWLAGVVRESMPCNCERSPHSPCISWGHSACISWGCDICY